VQPLCTTLFIAKPQGSFAILTSHSLQLTMQRQKLLMKALLAFG
jgi:hypothetical protein